MNSQPTNEGSTVGYRAKWVLPVASEPIENGVVVVRDDRIVAVGPHGKCDADEVIDLGPVAVLPGLVNAHTHLEFSDLEQPLGDPTAGFPAWIESVIAHRRAANDGSESTVTSVDPIKLGIQESISAGVVAIGEIATVPWSHAAYSADIAGVVFHEQLGNNPLESTQKTIDVVEAVKHFAAENWLPAISPHAPYSTGLTLFRSLTTAAIENGVPLAMHLAETLEEVEFVETGKGPFAEMLERLGVPFHRTAGDVTMGDYLQALAATRSLIIHGNYLDIGELEFVASEPNLHIVFCPRTHAYFQHKEYPLRTMLDLKINVAVGTDSRASNPDLNLFEELKQIAKTQPSVSPAEILQMGTLNGATALGLENEFGTLEPGKSAKFCVVSGLDSLDGLLGDRAEIGNN